MRLELMLKLLEKIVLRKLSRLHGKSAAALLSEMISQR